MTSIEIDEYFQTNLVNSLASYLEKAVNDLIKNEIKLDKLFELLEPYITSKDNVKRSRAIKLVSELITKLPSNFLNSLEIDHLATFLCSKLEDHYTCSVAAIPGLKNLLERQKSDSVLIEEKSKQNYISKETSIEIIKSILRDVHVQSMVQSDRFCVFKMCQFSLASDLIVQEMKNQKYETDFVYGLIQAMDGEKDPRNLYVCFDCINLFCLKLTLGPFVEETFEVFACYFPIDFTPPPSDNFTITKQMLIDSLRKCFAAKAEFAKFAMPLLMEKIDSSNEDAQIDAINTYTLCSKKYEIIDYKDYIDQLWNALQKLVMNASKSGLEEASLAAIEALASSIARSVQKVHITDESATYKSGLSIDLFVEKAMQSCVGYLKEPDLKLVWPNVKCLSALASSSSNANLLVNKKMIPLLIDHFKTTNFQNQKKTYLDILWQFVANSKKFQNNAMKVLEDNLDNLVEICIQNEPNKHLSHQCLIGFYHLLTYDNLIEKSSILKDAQSSNYYSIGKCLWHSLWIHENPNEIFEERKKLIEIFYILIKNDFNVLKWLFDSINDSFKENKSSLKQPITSYLISLEIIETLSAFYSLDDKITLNDLPEFILNTLESVVEDLNHLNVDCLIRLFDCMRITVQNLSKLEKRFVKLDNLIETLLEKSLSSDGLFSNTDIVIRLSYVFKVYSLKLKSPSDALNFLQRLSELFVNQSLETFKPLELESEFNQRFKLCLFLQVAANLDKIKFKNEIEQIFIQIKDKLIKLAIETNDNKEINEIACQFYAALLNKQNNVELINNDLTYFETFIKNEIETSELNEKRLKCLRLWIWCTKALVLREHESFVTFTRKIIEWISNPVLSELCSEAFNIILNNIHQRYLTIESKNAFNIKLFYRQRLFNSVINELKVKFDSTDSQNKELKYHYMMSVINMLNYLPGSVIREQIKLMLPILLYSLNTTNEENTNKVNEHLWLSSLKSFEILINSDTKCFASHTQEIIDRLLKMSLYDGNMNIRMLALKCLNSLAIRSHPNDVIKFQIIVTKHLAKCLNDKKRLCRQIAVEARNRWYLLTTKNVEN